jgi:hypothetical protein
MDNHIIEKMRRLGLTEQNASGAETLRLSAQLKAPLFNRDRQQRQDLLDKWQNQLQQKLEKHGGEVIPNSLSLTGQTVDIRVPVESLEAAEQEMSSEDTRLDPILPRQVVPS